MQKKLLSYTLVLCMFVCSQCAMRKSEPLKAKAFVPKNEKVQRGEIVYMANCNKCHPGGEAGIGPSLNANPAPQFIKRFQMRHGLGVMPAFKAGEISSADLHAISKYLHAWKHY